MTNGNPLIRFARGVESSSALDGVGAALRPVAERLIEDPGRRNVLQGHWLGHALHPLMTDVPLGMWMSGTVLDLVGGEERRSAAGFLIGLGVAAAFPTALTGLAEWGGLERTRDRRTGVAHALVNSTALACYAGSWLAHRRGRDRLGTRLAVAGGSAAMVGGYLGGHLTEARKVSSRNPEFADGLLD
jgi:uncharacterized membrane protein